MRLLFVFIGFGSSRGELAFANRQSFLSFPFQNPLAPKSPNVENVELKGEAFLQSLDLKSSREPKTFYTDPKRSWDIATATVPVSFSNTKNDSNVCPKYPDSNY